VTTLFRTRKEKKRKKESDDEKRKESIKYRTKV
jgi:hypothetical protein